MNNNFIFHNTFYFSFSCEVFICILVETYKLVCFYIEYSLFQDLFSKIEIDLIGIFSYTCM